MEYGRPEPVRPWRAHVYCTSHPAASTPDVDTCLSGLRDRALDLVQVDRTTWHPGPAAETLLPRATALAHPRYPRV